MGSRSNSIAKSAGPQHPKGSSTAVSGQHLELRQWSGPLPPAADLAAYDAVVPGCAERIVAMAESEQKHRHHLEDTVLTSDSRRSWAGLLGMFILAGMAIAGGIWLVAQGKSTEGLLVFAVETATLLFSLLKSFDERRRERQAHR